MIIIRSFVKEIIHTGKSEVLFQGFATSKILLFEMLLIVLYQYDSYFTFNFFVTELFRDVCHWITVVNTSRIQLSES